MFVVTGSTGFVGSAVVRKLLDRGSEVRVLCRPGSDQTNLEGLDIEIFEGDLLDPESLWPLLKGCEGLFHIAADYKLWTRNPNLLFETNYCGTKSIILAAKLRMSAWSLTRKYRERKHTYRPDRLLGRYPGTPALLPIQFMFFFSVSFFDFPGIS